jgi:hypothetical protein
MEFVRRKFNKSDLKACIWTDHDKKCIVVEFWTITKRYFKNKYLTKQYYDRKMKEFFELKLGSMTIDEYEIKLLDLLK